MKNVKILTVFLMFLLMVTNSGSAWPQSNSATPTISIQGNDYPNACDSMEKQDLEEVIRNKNIPKNTELWQIVDMLLCAPLTGTNAKKMMLATSSKIRIEAEGTGETKPDIKTVRANLKLVETFFAHGQAWRASLAIINNIARLQYSEDEACVAERVIEFSKGKWEIVGIGQACD